MLVYHLPRFFKPDDAVLVRRLDGPEDDASVKTTRGNVQRVGSPGNAVYLQVADEQDW